jgi:hypothetical protein
MSDAENEAVGLLADKFVLPSPGQACDEGTNERSTPGYTLALLR